MKIATKAIVYVNADNTQRLGTQDFQKVVAARAAELRDMRGYLSEYLEYVQDLTSEEIFNLTEEERVKIRQEYEDQCLEDAVEELLRSAWSQQTVEVEVEI